VTERIELTVAFGGKRDTLVVIEAEADISQRLPYEALR
jgi:hypothetical protein